MKQIFLDYRGQIKIGEVPPPTLRKGCVLVRNAYSLISSGTETWSIEGAGGILSKIAKNAGVLFNKILSDGFQNTIQEIKYKMNKMEPLGYSCAGKVIGKGDDIKNINLGDRVACAGTGYANHAEIVVVPRNLAAKIPDNVELKEAAFIAVGSIAMHGVRRAEVRFGENVVVIGLGLIGQLTSQILHAAGCKVIGIDPIRERSELMEKLGIGRGIVVGIEDPVKEVIEYTSGSGADAVIICASTSSNEPVKQAMDMARDRGKIIIIGNVGMDLPRETFYKKELEVRISRSYGPGRYDKKYEEDGKDYPIGYVRWTENRNMEEFLRMIADKRINVKSLISHEFPIEEAQKAYEVVMGDKKTIGVLIRYGEEERNTSQGRKIILNKNERIERDRINVAVIGLGEFARSVHLPNLKRISTYKIRAVVSRTGATSKQVAKQYKADYCTTNYREVLSDNKIDMVLIATRHNLHAPITIEATRAGKHIFVEKPMAMNYEECEDVYKAVKESKVKFTIGFNRRFSPLSIKAKELLTQKKGPLMINYRVNVGTESKNHWINDPIEGGGRVIGEVCHFLDLCYWFVEAEPERIFAEKISSDSRLIDDNNIAATIYFSDGSVASLTYTTLGSSSFPKERIEIFADGAVIVIDDFKRLILEGFKGKSIKLRRADKGHYNELIEFSKAIRGEKSTAVTVEDGVRATVCSLKILDALKSRKPQVIDLARNLKKW